MKVKIRSAHKLATDFSIPTRPFCIVHLGNRLLGKTTTIFEPDVDKGDNGKPEKWTWLEDDESATFNFSNDDIATMFDFDSESESSDSYSDENSSSSNSVSSPTSSVSTSSTASSSPSSAGSHSTSDLSKRQHRDIIVQCFHSESAHKKKVRRMIV